MPAAGYLPRPAHPNATPAPSTPGAGAAHNRAVVGAPGRVLGRLTVQLKRVPAAGAIREEGLALRQRLADCEARYLDAREARVEATAEIGYLDDVLGEGMATLVRELLVLTGGRRDDPRFTRVLPTQPTEAMRGLATPDQHRYVYSAVERVQSGDTYTALRPTATRLAEQQTALEAALAERETAYRAEAAATAERQAVIDEACRFYNLAYPRLRLLLPDQPARVESLFPTLRPRRAPEADESPSPAE